MLNLRCCSVAMLTIILVGILISANNIECQEQDERRADYTGFKVFRLTPKTEDQLERLIELNDQYEFNSSSIQFWTEPSRLNRSVDVMVSPMLRDTFMNSLDRWHMSPNVLIDDVERVIKQTSGGPRPTTRGQSVQFDNTTSERLGDILSAREFFTRYHTYNVIEYKLKSLEKDPRVTLQTIGSSTEGRKMYLVKISSDTGGKSDKPVILIDAGHHAREWISFATGLYLMESLINNNMPTGGFLRRRNMRKMLQQRDFSLQNFDFWFIPAVNPDGYDYSHSYDRLWRKTRSGGRVCGGVDPNRNYPYHWGESGASPYACDETYAGPRALSEPETRAVASVMDSGKGRIKAYLSLHSYGQYILAPYGYARVKPDNYQAMEKVARAWQRGVRGVRGTRYQFGTSSIMLYPAAGGSDDYAHGQANIPYSYTIELPDSGRRGFLLPPREIIPVGQETVMGMHALLTAMSESTRVGEESDGETTPDEENYIDDEEQ